MCFCAFVDVNFSKHTWKSKIANKLFALCVEQWVLTFPRPIGEVKEIIRFYWICDSWRETRKIHKTREKIVEAYEKHTKRSKNLWMRKSKRSRSHSITNRLRKARKPVNFVLINFETCYGISLVNRLKTADFFIASTHHSPKPKNPLVKLKSLRMKCKQFQWETMTKKRIPFSLSASFNSRKSRT